MLCSLYQKHPDACTNRIRIPRYTGWRETAGLDPEGKTGEEDRVGGQPEISDKQEKKEPKRRLKDSKACGGARLPDIRHGGRIQGEHLSISGPCLNVFIRKRFFFFF